LWIYLGCLIPDFPWIVRKIIDFAIPSINGYDLQLFAIVQASLFFSLLLSATFSSFSKNFWRTFLILAIGSLLHLLLDPIQTKWANGVHLFAPFNWELTNYGFFWPESFGTYFLTLTGLLFFIFNWNNLKGKNPQISFSRNNIILGSLFALIYFLAPFQFITEVELADNHFVSTFRNYSERAGKYVETDRKKTHFDIKTNSYWIESSNNDYVELSGVENLESSKLSIQGRFITNDLIEVENYQENWIIFRDGASYLGLLLILIAWITPAKKKGESLTFL
jgi:hypothetical protein